jgi:hypothetical protein
MFMVVIGELMILVALAGWQEPKYIAFITRTGKFYVARYESLWQAKDSKAQQENNAVFSMILEEIQQRTANTWRIPREVVQETEGIVKFKASWHHTWIQVVRDPNRAWLKMQYCVTREEVE